jgi:hypothetical protein
MCRWEDDIKLNLKNRMEIDWIKLDGIRDK